MRKLILCADRDDDIGEKTGIETPIIGREENLQAAVKLGLKDPEDSDTNSIFSAISLYDDLKEKGEDVEIATICGAPSIGYTSDEILSKELDRVLKETEPDSAILVTDGAEDEYISPIVSSKIDLSHIRTVYVKQSESVENIYYLFVKMFREKGTQRKIFLPISLALLVYGFFRILALLSNLIIEGISALEGLPGFGLGAIFFVIGLYLIVKIYELDRKGLQLYHRLDDAIREGAVWLPFAIVSLLVIFFSSLQGWQEATAAESALEMIITFVSYVLLWWIGAVFLYELGRLIDTFIKKGRVKWSFWAIFLTLFALTFIFWGAIDYIGEIMELEEGFMAPWDINVPFYINIILGLLIGIVAGLTQRSFKERQKREDDNRTESTAEG